MAYTEITVQEIGRTTPLTPTFETPDAANGNWFDNTGRNRFVFVKNNSGGDLTITVNSNQTVDSDLTVPDRTIVVSNTDEDMIGPFPSSPYHFTEGSNNNAVRLDWSTSTSVEVAVISLTPS